MEEKRKHDRWQTEDKKAVLLYQGDTQVAPLFDLSTAGMRVVLEDGILQPGSTVRGEIEVFAQQKPYFIEGSVVWARSVPQENRFEAGIRFEKIRVTALT